MRTTFLFLIFIFSTLAIKAVSVEDYYASAEGKSGDVLKTELHNIISNGQVVLSYSQVWDALKTTDEDPNNSNNVILLYTGWSYPKNINGGDAADWNREHTWAKSMGNFGTSNGPGTDIHHLRPTDVTVNSARGNLFFDEGGSEYVDGTRYDSGSGATGCYRDGDSWEPRDEVKGDVARMLFYMATRYESEDGYDLELAEYSSTSGLHGKLSTLLKWHEEDPVDEWELTRNEKIYNIQNNRNPFIDHPEYVELIWGEGSGVGSGGGSGSGDTEDYTIIFSEDFQSGELNNMTEYSVFGDNQIWYASGSGNLYAKMSGYDNGTHHQNEDWLINAQAINLSGYKDLSLSFTTMMKIYQGETNFTVLVSSDYDGTSDPGTFNWTDITSQAALSTNAFTAVHSGDIDLSDWAGKRIYIAFKFNCTSTGSNTWNVDDIIVKGLKSTAINEVSNLNMFLYPNPAHNQFFISGIPNNQGADVAIYSQAGNLKLHHSVVENNLPIDIGTLKSGLYFVKIELEAGETVIKKVIIK